MSTALPPTAAVDLSTLTYLTVQQAAVYMQMPSENALRTRMSRGTVPDWLYTRMGGSVRFIRRSIDQWAQENVRSIATR